MCKQKLDELRQTNGSIPFVREQDKEKADARIYASSREWQVHVGDTPCRGCHLAARLT